jgi:hypothetical protein
MTSFHEMTTDLMATPPILQAIELLLEALIRRPSHARWPRRELIDEADV